MKKLNKNKAYNYKDLNESQLVEFRKRVILWCDSNKPDVEKKVYYDKKNKMWLNVAGDDGKYVTKFTNAKELFD